MVFLCLSHIPVSLLSRQDTPNVSASNVIIVSIVNTRDGLEVTFFIRIMSGVISVQTTVNALQVNNYMY